MKCFISDKLAIFCDLVDFDFEIIKNLTRRSSHPHNIANTFLAKVLNFLKCNVVPTCL